MQKLLIVIVFLFVLKPMVGQTIFNPDQTTETSKNSTTNSGKSDHNGKINFKEFAGFSYEILAGFSVPSRFPLTFYSFGFYPRYNFITPKDWLSLSIGSPSSFGFDFQAGSNGTLFRYLIDVPLSLDLNIGARATSKNESLFGAFLGAGLAYNFMHVYYAGDKLDVNTFGPFMHGGLRWTMNGRPSGIRISFLQGLASSEATRSNVFMFTFVYGL